MRIKRLGKRILPIILATICTFALAVPALADDGIDVTEKGSIRVDIKAYATEQAVTGGSLNLYYVADVHVVSGQVVYQYTSDFSDCDPALLDQDTIAQDTAETAEAFADFVSENDVEPTDTKELDSSGEAVFEDLSVGLYLITQNEPAEGYNAIKAFLVTLPINEDGSWIYDVDASPKTSPEMRISSITINVEDYMDGSPIAGAEFTLQNSDGEYASLDANGSVVWSKNKSTFTIPAGGITFPDLEEGNYVLTQIGATDGYLLPDGNIYFMIDSDGITWITEAPEYGGQPLAIAGGEAGAGLITVINIKESDANNGAGGTDGTGDNGAGGTGSDTGSGSGGHGGANGTHTAKTGDYNLHIYGVLIVGAAAALVVVLRRRLRRAAD